MQRKRKVIAEINVVPYIDVTLVLLIIFMITAPLLQQGVEVTLPELQAKTVKETELPPAIITVDVASRLFFSYANPADKPLSRQDIIAYCRKLKKQHPNLVYYVKGDSRIAYGEIANILGLLQSVGIDKVALITQPPIIATSTKRVVR